MAARDANEEDNAARSEDVCCGRRESAPRLETLAEVLLLKMLKVATRRRSWHSDRTALSHIVYTHVPHTVRQRLQERVLQDWRVYDTVSLRMLHLLFSCTTTSLRLVHVRTFYRDDLIVLLPRLTGIKELCFQDSTWELSRRQLGLTADALSRMVHLRVLTLQYCGHNLLLATVGAHCPHLQVLDVRGSQAVDDDGMWGLVTVNHAFYAYLARHALSHSSVPQTHKPSLSISSCWLLAFKSLTSKMMMKMTVKKTQSTQVNNSGDAKGVGDETCRNVGALTSERERVDQEDISWSQCCSSLVFLDIRCTGVTPAGVTILAQALPAHTSLAHDAHTLNTHAPIISTHAHTSSTYAHNYPQSVPGIVPLSRAPLLA
nr:uncharacterized protein LOC128691109 isoform X1 [Cherax quadricarinatus]XP_053635895.1 uncharacterized protein LOC128691109 isoform X1 [Cherax quadricarinatus]XP_053635896.1 uncharacterized protein LOC128691109 isoform X1 [Cherax quadricarinatus]